MTSSTSNSEAMPPLPGLRPQIISLRKLVLRILLPLAVIGAVTCLGLDWVVKKQIIQKTPSHGAAKLLRVREPHPGEIPIIGSSRALCSYIPDSLGTNYYNYGINGIGYAVMDVFLKQELAQRDKTGPIILNFDYGMFYYQTGDLNAYIPNLDIPGLRELVKRGGRYSGHLEVPGIRYFGCLDAFVRDHLNDRLQLTKAINNGAVLEKAAIKSEEFAKLVRQRKDTVEKFEPSMELVDTLMKRIHDHPNRQFLIVMAPYHSSFYASIAPAGRVRADSIMAALDALPNARFIRFDTRDWSDSLFFNTTHVGLAGARKMSQMLRDSLREPFRGEGPHLGGEGLHLGGEGPPAQRPMAQGTSTGLRVPQTSSSVWHLRPRLSEAGNRQKMDEFIGHQDTLMGCRVARVRRRGSDLGDFCGIAHGRESYSIGQRPGAGRLRAGGLSPHLGLSPHCSLFILNC